MKHDWRASVKNINNLYEADPVDILIVLRHIYINVAKSMFASSFTDDHLIGQKVCEAIESLEKAIECQAENILSFESAFRD